MEYIPEETIREIRNNLPLLRLVVSRKTKLDALGWGLCPFHKEKSPSFHTFFGADRARYHCFGCGATGDIFNYMQNAEFCTFKLSVIKLKYLIKNSGVSLLPTEPPEPAKSDAVSQVAVSEFKPFQNGNTYNPYEPQNCYLKCKNYAQLEELYKEVWEENQKFRVWLNLNNFEPKKERS